MLVIANYAGCNVHLVSGIYVSHASDINTEEGHCKNKVVVLTTEWLPKLRSAGGQWL